LHIEFGCAAYTFYLQSFPPLGDYCWVFNWSGLSEPECLQHYCLAFFGGHKIGAADWAWYELVFADIVELEFFFAAGASKRYCFVYFHFAFALQQQLERCNQLRLP
jgi:hypothetical protein